MCLSGEWGKSNAKERDSPYFRSPEAGISEFGKRLLHYVTLFLQPSSHVLNLILYNNYLIKIMQTFLIIQPDACTICLN